jgi:hypothetical protein
MIMSVEERNASWLSPCPRHDPSAVRAPITLA